nr:MAG TPA: tail protein [Caudoviricetes sp.]
MDYFSLRLLRWSLKEIMIYKAKDNERLDTIVFKHYGHLRFFEQVLAVNTKLKPILKAGDTVILPEFKEVKSKEQAKLW